MSYLDVPPNESVTLPHMIHNAALVGARAAKSWIEGDRAFSNQMQNTFIENVATAPTQWQQTIMTAYAVAYANHIAP